MVEERRGRWKRDIVKGEGKGGKKDKQRRGEENERGDKRRYGKRKYK